MPTEADFPNLYDLSKDLERGRIRLAYMTGAAAAFGLIGMAEAIRRTHLRYREIRVTRAVAPPISLEPDAEPIGDWLSRAVLSPSPGPEGKVEP